MERLTKQILFCATLLAAATALSACSSDAKAQRQGQNLVDERNDLAHQLSALQPNEFWSEAQFRDYSAKLERLEALNREERGVNGTHGITITNSGGDFEYIKQQREILKAFRLLCGWGDPTPLLNLKQQVIDLSRRRLAMAARLADLRSDQVAAYHDLVERQKVGVQRILKIEREAGRDEAVYVFSGRLGKIGETLAKLSQM